MKWLKIFETYKNAQEALENNKPRLLKVGDKRICLTRLDKNIFASADRCPHNSESLSKGTVNYLGEIICPWHNYRFSLKDGRESQSRCSDLKIYPIEVRTEGVFIKLES